MDRALRAQLPPGPRAPRVLQLIGTWTRPTASLERLRRYGHRATVQLPFQPPFVMLWDPADIKELFAAPADVVHPGEGASILAPIVGANSVILLDEDVHLAQRRLMLPAFHGERMRALRGVMAEICAAEVSAWPTGEPVALHPRLQAMTLEIILRAVFGLERGATLARLRDLLGDVLAFSESPLSVLPALQRWLRWTPTQRRFDRLMAATDELILAMIAERRAGGAWDDSAAGPAGGAPVADASAGEDIFSTLLAARHEDGREMSAQELRDELMTALVAGHETTASQLAWALERLSREPEVQARLRAEVDAGESEAYLNATITEILRLRPVLPNAEPRLVKREIEIGGVRYPPGVVLLASAQLVHLDPDIYPEPRAFRPERFLATGGRGPDAYTWLPFGGGRRRCLGASFAQEEMRIALREVITRFELAAAGPRGETTRRRSITFSPSRSATVVLHPRSRVTPAPEPLAALA
ncbi:MAG TPA: cytochrome P450 [Solirubrobacteraceae bacterium]|nr:cytochrome P450 [Solirubrobacteraceae bacterium]